VNPLCRDLLLNGLRQRVWMFDGQAPAILALHGFTGSGRDFAPIADPLERQIAAPDLEGHGPDIPTDPDAYTMARVTAGLEATMNELELGRVPVLGYSMGGRTALQFALAAPERVEGNGVHDFADWWEQLPILASQDRIAEPWRTAMRQRRRRQSGPGLASSLRGMGTGAMKSVWARLVELDIPTLLLTGEHDLKFTALAQEMLGLLPQASHVVLRRAGHCAHLERPDEAAAQIQAFLRELAIR
jgi:2-succinyl-6-hydroxy-2,4-cyclohexadiene-1-carboxylate synthase